MEDLNYCEAGGYLVGPRVPLAESPFEFHMGIEPTAVGCTRLRCSLCNDWVRITPDSVSDEVEYRTYSCKCRNPDVHLWGEEIETIDEHEYIVIPSHWRCRGHPVQPLPFELDGVRIAHDIDFDGLVSKTLDGWSPELARPKEREYKIAWLMKLYVRLTKTGLERSIPLAVSRCLTHPSARVRSAALEFFRRLPHLPEAERIVELAEGDRSLFKGIPDPLIEEATLEDSLLRMLGFLTLPDKNECASRALEVARIILLQPGQNQALYWYICRTDEDWFLDHLEEIVRANPRSLESLFDALCDFREFPLMAARIARCECVNPDEVRRLTKEYLMGFDRLFVTRALERRAASEARRNSTRAEVQADRTGDEGYVTEGPDPHRRHQ